MQALHRLASSTCRMAASSLRHDSLLPRTTSRILSFSSDSPAGGGSFDAAWESSSSWSTGLAGDHFNGQSPLEVLSNLQETEDSLRQLEAENRRGKAYCDSWRSRLEETTVLLKQVQEPGARGSYLKDSEKAEMYRLHKKNPEVYTVEKLARDYRIMRQRVHAILWLKEIEEEEEKKLGHPLDDSVEQLLDSCPEFFNSHDREFHVASLPYKPDFKVMPEGWDGITKDVDEVHYEISKKEDEMLYREFVEKMNFNKKKVTRPSNVRGMFVEMTDICPSTFINFLCDEWLTMAGEVKCHKYSRRRPSDGWTFTVEKLGSGGKRGGGGGWKFASMPDGSSRPLNEMEKMYVKRETPRRRRRILP